MHWKHIETQKTHAIGNSFYIDSWQRSFVNQAGLQKGSLCGLKKSG